MSAMFFIFWYIRTGFFRTQLTLAFLLLVTVTVQPMQAYFYLNKNSEEKESLYAHETRSPGFHYDLHLKGGDIEGPLPDAFYIALGQVQLLASHVDWPVFRSYASKKFHVYARVAEVNNPVDWQKISLSIKGEINTVFVDGWDQGGVLSRGTDSAFAISNSKQGVEVLRYWENGIRFQTGFKSPKFLVYADAYHPHWSCRMDGNPCRIYRSNVAFKGLYLPPGEHLITLTFSSHAVVRYLLWMMFFGVFLSLCYMAWKDAEKGVAL